MKHGWKNSASWPSGIRTITRWLRYYLDFCHKYSFVLMDRQSLLAFQEKLRTKHQPKSLRQQAGTGLEHGSGMLTHDDDKGRKDRTVPLPQTLLAALNAQLARVAQVHAAD